MKYKFYKIKIHNLQMPKFGRIKREIRKSVHECFGIGATIIFFYKDVSFLCDNKIRTRNREGENEEGKGEEKVEEKERRKERMERRGEKRRRTSARKT